MNDYMQAVVKRVIENPETCLFTMATILAVQNGKFDGMLRALKVARTDPGSEQPVSK